MSQTMDISKWRSIGKAYYVRREAEEDDDELCRKVPA